MPKLTEKGLARHIRAVAKEFEFKIPKLTIRKYGSKLIYVWFDGRILINLKRLPREADVSTIESVAWCLSKVAFTQRRNSKRRMTPNERLLVEQRICKFLAVRMCAEGPWKKTNYRDRSEIRVWADWLGERGDPLDPALRRWCMPPGTVVKN